MILGKVVLPNSTTIAAQIGEFGKDVYSPPRFYCGPFNGNRLTETMGVIMDMSWVAGVVDQVTALMADRWPGVTDLRESIVCTCGVGNSDKDFLMRNYLDCGVRVHVPLSPRGGSFIGPRTIEYQSLDAVAFDGKDFGAIWRHQYDKGMIQLVLVFMDVAHADKGNWQLFAEHNRKVTR